MIARSEVAQTPGPGSLCDYLALSAMRNPQQVAVVGPGGQRFAYGELFQVARRIAGYLAAAGVRPGDRVGVIAPKSVEVVATICGILEAGAAYVPADYTAPASRNRMLLVDCGVRVAFLHPDCAGILDEWPEASPPKIVWLGESEAVPFGALGTGWSAAARHDELMQPRCPVAGDLAYILYTSGSTGVPKGVMLTHGNATSFVEWCAEALGFTSSDRLSSHAPFHFDLSVLDLYASLKHGATLYLISEAASKNPDDLARFIETNKLTVWYSTPSILSLLAQFGGLDARDCTSLRMVLFAGEVFPVKHLRSIVRQWSQARFYNLYGPTETNVCTFAQIPKSIPDGRVEPYPIGHLCSNCEGLVLDAPGGNLAPRGEEGLLHIAGATLFQGYWNKSSTELFFERDGKRFYNTGDVVKETPDDGFIYVGRRDRMVKRRGYRIELGEIERALYQHAGLREVAAISIADASTGTRIVAFVSPQPDQRPTIVELKTFCGRVLPSYMNPDVFRIMDALPRTSTDKVDYQALIQLNAVERAVSVQQ